MLFLRTSHFTHRLHSYSGRRAPACLPAGLSTVLASTYCLRSCCFASPGVCVRLALPPVALAAAVADLEAQAAEALACLLCLPQLTACAPAVSVSPRFTPPLLLLSQLLSLTWRRRQRKRLPVTRHSPRPACLPRVMCLPSWALLC